MHTHTHTCLWPRLRKEYYKNENMVVSYFKVFFRLKIYHLFPLRQILTTFAYLGARLIATSEHVSWSLPDARQNLEPP